MQVTDLITPGRARLAIRQKIKSLLLDRTNAKQEVYISQSLPTDEEQLPRVLIYTTGEKVDDFDESPKRYKREMNLLIECIVAGDDDDKLDEELEFYGDAVEAAIENDDSLELDFVEIIRLTATEFSRDSIGASPIGRLTMQYSVIYILPAIVEKTITDLNGADIDWRLTRPEALPNTVDAEDTINLQQ